MTIYKYTDNDWQWLTGNEMKNIENSNKNGQGGIKNEKGMT